MDGSMLGKGPREGVKSSVCHTSVSPNQRIALWIWFLVSASFGSIVSTVYEDAFSSLIPRLPCLGRMVPWGIGFFLGLLAALTVLKLLDRFRPKGKRC